MAKIPVQKILPVLFVAETAFLLYMSFQPSYAVHTFRIPFLREGDMEHFVAYALYGILSSGTISVFSSRNKVVAPLWCGIFAGMTEFIQSFVPTRFSDPMDWVVDFTGSVVGIFIFERLLAL